MQMAKLASKVKEHVKYHMPLSTILTESDENVDILIEVRTGDQRGAGTDCKVFVILYDINDSKSPPLRLKRRFITNCRGQTCQFKVASNIPNVSKITTLEFWLEKFGVGEAWFVEEFKITIMKSNSSSVFPLHRWVNPNFGHQFIVEHDCYLPQFCLPFIMAQRRTEIRRKSFIYQYKQAVPNGPVQIAELPSDEKFSEEYFTCFVSERLKLLMQMKFINLTSPTWNSFTDLRRVYKHSLGEPECFKVWNEDWWFGLQRVQGVDPMLIQLCKQIPDKLGVDEETVKGLIDDFTLEEAINNNKIFICDIDITDGLVCPENREVASPIALFYLNKEDKLMPIAIQLRQKKADDNPVFTPKDAPNTWLVAKIFYNNAEAQHHQSLTHLGYTHFLMEGVCVCTHRNLSPSHPMFKLMAPHFLFLLAINTRGLEKLVNPGGWVDCCMTQGVEGMFALMIRGFDRWSFNIHSSPERNLRNRGVLDPNILPYYPYRDDAIPLHNAIKNYVTKVVNHYYDTEDKIREDHELKMWRDELVKDRNNNGVGLKDLPGSDHNGFETVDEIIEVVTFIISTCSLGHAASNFQQYEQYAFVPNYAGLLMDNPPRKKKEYTDSDLVSLIPNKEKTLEIMVITKLLSLRATQSLGDFEMQYMYHPKDVQAAEEFRSELNSLHLDILEKEEKRKDIWKFPHLDPVYIPNSISV